MELAAIVSLGVLEGRWKAAGARVQGPIREPGADTAASALSGDRLPASAPGETNTVGGDALRLAVQFRDIGEWATISKKLSQVPGVENIDVAGLSGRSARITLQFAGGTEQLAQVAPEYGLRLQQTGAGWVLSAQ